MTTVLQQNLGQDEIVNSISNLLSRFAHKGCDALRIKRNRSRLYKDTGVMHDLNYKGQENIIVFSFFLPRVSKNGKPVAVGVRFDIDEFNTVPDEYVLNMVNTLKLGIKKANEQADRLKSVAS